jgi:hypothetical protein
MVIARRQHTARLRTLVSRPVLPGEPTDADDYPSMRAVLMGLLTAGSLLLASAPASADVVFPRDAHAFHESVGVSTHIVYYDSAYGDWPPLLAKLEELGVRHLRDGVYGNPALRWREWNERYYRAVELAAARGMRFNFGIGRPGYEAGTLDQLIGVVAGRLRHAAEALETPNEFDHYVGGRDWPARLRYYIRSVYRKASASRSLRSLPVVGPSFATQDGPRLVGDQSPWLDLGNIHPYTGGLSPQPAHIRSELARARVTAGSKPVWATEVGYHNALRATGGQPGVPERAGAVYLLRTFLEHFKGGIDRTYVYELVDPYREPQGEASDLHFGLLRHDLSPKPAFTALKNLLTLVGRGGSHPRLRPLRIDFSRDGWGVRHLLLRKADGTYVLALWRLASVWDRDRRHWVRVSPRSLTLVIPGARRVGVADPVASATIRPLHLREGSVRLSLAGRPKLLHITPAQR